MPSKGDPVVAIACTLFTFSARGHQGEAAQPSGPAEAAEGGAEGSAAGEAAAAAAAQQGAAAGSRDASPDLSGDGLGGADGGEEEEAEQEAVLTAAAVAGGPTAAGGRRGRAQAPAGAAERETVVFLLHPAAAHERQQAEERSCGPAGASARVLLFGSEAELLLTWAHFLRLADPDAIGLFQAGGGWGGTGGKSGQQLRAQHIELGLPCGMEVVGLRNTSHRRTSSPSRTMPHHLPAGQ